LRPDRFRDPVLLLARLLLAAVFLYDAALLIQFPDANAGYLEQFGVPGALIYPALALQLGGSVLIAAGLLTRPAALALALFCLMTALIFHHDFGDAGEAIQFGKDIGLTGGYLLLAASGAGRFSLDRLLFGRGRG
jgi:putative oxidoreductase